MAEEQSDLKVLRLQEEIKTELESETKWFGLLTEILRRALQEAILDFDKIGEITEAASKSCLKMQNLTEKRNAYRADFAIPITKMTPQTFERFKAWVEFHMGSDSISEQ